MSSTRNMKRKRSKAGSPATSSTRQRAVAPEVAQDDATSSSTAVPDPKDASAAPPTSSATTTTPTTTTTSRQSRSSSSTTSTKTSGAISPAEKGSNRSGNKAATESAMRASESTENGRANETEAIYNGRSAAKRNTESANCKSKSDTKATSAMDGSSSCSSSQDGTSTRRQALHLANDEDDREKRMRDLLSHRSILLQRVKECRMSAEKRLGEKLHQGNTIINNNNNNNIKTISAQLSDDKEIAAFKHMTEEAEKIDRKAREKDGGTKKRTSLSLRRGSNVGKRMNTALSSLAPGSLSTGSSGDNVKTGGTATTTAGATKTKTNSGMTPANNAVTPNSKSDLKGGSPSTKASGLKSSGRQPANYAPGNVLSTANAQSTSTKSKANSKSSQNQSTKLSDNPTRGRPPSSKSAKTTKSGTAAVGQNSLASSAQNSKKNGAALSSASRSSSAGAGFHPQLVASYQGPKVNFPEAIMLREKKQQIEMKLRKILVERQQRNNKSSKGLSSILPGSSGKLMSSASSMFDDETSRRTVGHGSVGMAKQLSSKKTFHATHTNNNNNNNNHNLSNRFTDELEISRPAPLPARRRTHWDTLLEEMSWLASDFIEERKWKLSASRLISSKMQSHGLSFDRRKRPLAEAHRGNADGSSRDLSIEGHGGDSISSDDPNTGRKRKDPRQKYIAFGTEDEDEAKCKSRVLSCMISELDLALQTGGALKESDKHLHDALDKFRSSRLDILKTSKISKGSGDKSEACDEKGDTDMTTASDIDESSEESHDFDSIDDYIEHFHSLSKSKHKLPAKETKEALKCGKLKFNPKQKEMFEFVDKLWTGSPCSGAVILGPPISGKTFVTATILWKQRSNGFQLLICPSRSLIRWKHELTRFSDLRVLIFGLTGGISNPNNDNDVNEIEPADVVLCEYGLIGRMKNALGKMGVSPFSVVVDLRHFYSLRQTLCGNTSVSTDDTDFPSELKSNGWWGDVVDVANARGTRCLLVEYGDSDPLSLSSRGLGQKERISILAKRAACIIGPNLFDSKSHSVHREVIAWARKKGKREITDKALRIAKVLAEAIGPMCFHVAKPILPMFDSKWELRQCEMTADQRKEYETCCVEVRGALSSTLCKEPTSDEYNYSVPVVCDALFRLRQRCFYSPKHAIHPHSTLPDKSLEISQRNRGISSAVFVKGSNRLRNASQPDASNAQFILNSSSKLKELVSILVSEGGYNLNFEESTKKMLGLLPGARKWKEAKRSAKKIVIFAALPDVQHVISMLLDSLGIQNELLCRLGTCTKNRDKQGMKFSGIDHNTKTYNAVSWIKSQTVLSTFCGENNSRNTDVIIAAPAAFSRPNDGIGVEGADMIITLDSDWSGRDEFIVDTLVRRWCARNKLSGKENRLIRLVCADSVEEKVFHDCERGKKTCDWPLDIDGFFSLPSSDKDCIEVYKDVINRDRISFPAVGILQHRNDLLEDVLVSSGQIPSFFESGKSAIFLPKLNHVDDGETLDDNEIFAEFHLLRRLLKSEKMGEVSRSEVTTLPKPSTTETIPTGLISRQDVTVIESRLRLEKFIMLNSRQDEVDDNSSIHVLKCQVSFLNGGQAPDDAAVPKIDENPSSLLFYEPLSGLDERSNRFSSTKSTNIVSPRRHNAYAKLFSENWNGVPVRDGNQGCEPLVFFPPLFPLLEESSKRARMEYSSSAKTTKYRGTTDLGGDNEMDSALKRKNREFAIAQNDTSSDRKRPKVHSLTANYPTGHSRADPSSGPLVTGSTAQFLAKSKDELENGKASIMPRNCTGESKANGGKSSRFLMVKEDFGLLGTGAFPRPIDVVSFSAHDPRPNSSVLSFSNRFDYLSFNTPCDAEETSTSTMNGIDEGMRSVLLFVKKRPRSSQSAFKHGGLSTITASSIGGKGVGDEPGKKMRKKGNLQVTPTAFTRLPASTSSLHSQSVPRVPNFKLVKGDYRHKLLASLKATGLTLFDSIPYRKAALRVEGKMAKRLEKLMWKSTIAQDSGPGLPIQLAEKSSLMSQRDVAWDEGWDSAIEQLKSGSSPGDLARTQSTIQHLDFKKSLVSPRRVDFGAFEVGYMGSPSGMTTLSAPHSRLGVSLPMGVKVMQPSEDQKKRSTWNAVDDKFLQQAAERFGMNWLLVASAMSGFEHVIFHESMKSIQQIVPSVPKSARQCRDRWQILVKSRPSLLNEINHPNAFFHESVSFQKSSIPELVPSKDEAQSEVLSKHGVNVLCPRADLISHTKTEGSTVDTHMIDTERKDSLNAKTNVIDSPRSTVDKKDDHVTNKEESSDDAEMTGGVNLTGAFESKEERPKRRSFSAISVARSRRQIFPITIPGVDMAGGHPARSPSNLVPSHPSHMQSVQMSVAAQWPSANNKSMWPLQILDVADRQRSSAARVSMQRGEIHPATHKNQHRHHSTANASYQHRPQSTAKPAAVRAPVGYAPAMTNTGQSVAPRPVNPSIPPHHQHRGPSVAAAAAAAQAYHPPPQQTNSGAKLKKSENPKPSSKASPKKGDK